MNINGHLQITDSLYLIRKLNCKLNWSNQKKVELFGNWQILFQICVLFVINYDIILENEFEEE